MNLNRGICHWVGEIDTEVGEFLRLQGFEIVPHEHKAYSGFAEEGHHFYVIRCDQKPTSQCATRLAGEARKRHTVVVWTEPEYASDWYQLGTELVLTSGPIDQIKHFLDFAIKMFDDRSQWREAEERLTRTNDDLHASIESLEIASRRFEALFNGLPIGCFTFDAKGMIHEWNGLATEIFGIEGYQAFLNSVWDVLDPDYTGAWSAEQIAEIFASDGGSEFDWTFTRDDGDVVHLACKVVCLTNKKGEVVAAIAGNLDITARVLAQERLEEQMRENRNYLKVMERQRLKLQEANRQLRRLAVTDGLTSLTNRRRFNELLEEVLDRAIRQSHTFSVLMFDIDHFKSLNDVFGHQAGDEILEKFAEILRETARRYERPARYGGEEFAIILDNCDKTSSLIAAERFRTAINTYHWPYREITSSIGCSTFTGVESVRELVEQADYALYASKNNGRNCVTHIDDVPREAKAA
ncbi:MAG: diguanylate cyclase [Armatimonadetes bacterium]|nr:diguanylate cyclase [Armatimonadota bacterium]MBS1703631.1 diguanylate cyclase [Armatimonadota bacterium]MBS1728359.1 diguanylate cyclase [Armatimonadota bacterium]